MNMANSQEVTETPVVSEGVIIKYGYTTTGGCTNTSITNGECSWDPFCGLLEKPEVGKKDGPYFTRGPCIGTRKNNGIIEPTLVLLDGDSSINLKTKQVTVGAPAPVLVHEALTKFNITHCIYTSFSNQEIKKRTGECKGHRYRGVIPTAGYKPEDIDYLVGWLIEALHEEGIGLNDVTENHTVAQAWYFPRLRSEGAEFTFYRYDGGLLDVDKCLDEYEIIKPSPKAKASKPYHVYKKNGKSFYDQFKRLVSVHEILEDNGFKLKKSSVSPNGGMTYRYEVPGGTGGGGVMVLLSNDGQERVYSHHSTPEHLGNGKHAMDAVDLFSRLNGNNKKQSENEIATRMMCAIILERRFKDYNKKFYAIREKKGLIVNDVRQTVEGDFAISSATPRSLKTIFHTEPPLFSVKDITEKSVKIGFKIVPKHDPLKEWFFSEETQRLHGVDSIPIPVADNLKIQRITPQGNFNQFSGWPCRPQKIKGCREVELIKFYLREILCAGHEPSFNQLWGYLAHMLQKPAEKPQWAVLLRGGRGSGKTTLCDLLIAIMGKRLSAKYDKGLDDLLAQFSSEKLGKMFEFYDDLGKGMKGKSNVKEILGAIQAKVTTTFGAIEGKGADKIFVDAFARLFFSANFQRSLPISKDERRYLVLDVPAWMQKNLWFFEELQAAIGQQHVINALVYELVSVDLDAIGFDPFSCIETPGLKAATAFSVENSGMDAWFGNVLQREFVNVDRDDDSFEWNYSEPTTGVLKRVFQDDYAKWTKRESATDLTPGEKTSLGMYLGKYMDVTSGGAGNCEFRELEPKKSVIERYEKRHGIDLRVNSTGSNVERLRASNPEIFKDNPEAEKLVNNLASELRELWIDPSPENIFKLDDARDEFQNALKGVSLVGEGQPKSLEREASKKLAFLLFPELKEIDEA